MLHLQSVEAGTLCGKFSLLIDPLAGLVNVSDDGHPVVALTCTSSRIAVMRSGCNIAITLT